MCFLVTICTEIIAKYLFHQINFVIYIVTFTCIFEFQVFFLKCFLCKNVKLKMLGKC